MKTKRHQWMFKATVMTLAFLLLSGLLVPHFVKELVAKEIDQLHLQAEPKEGNQAVYDPVLPDYTIKYGKDFAEHDGFHNEVWHYRANLKGDDGLDYGVSGRFIVLRTVIIKAWVGEMHKSILRR